MALIQVSEILQFTQINVWFIMDGLFHGKSYHGWFMIVGVHIVGVNGGSPIAGWFISWNIRK